MLKKIISIKNVGKFQDCRAAGDVEFRRMTLICAENARGKTTFSDILRSLQCGDGDIIVGRQTLGCSDGPEVVLRLDAGNTTFKDRSWSMLWPNIALFDTIFVHQNVFAGDYIDHSHKKNLYRVIVGEEGVKLTQKVAELDAQIRELNKEINSKQDIAERFAPKGMTLEKFLALPQDNDIDSKIHSANVEVAALEHASEILSKTSLDKIDLPALPVNFSKLLSKTLDNVSTAAERLVREHMNSHYQSSK